MRQALWTFVTLLSHWRRHPANLAALLVGLAIATALWSGVQALNDQARASYDRAAALFTTGGAQSIVAARGGLFPQELYIKLRLSGWKVSPVLEGRVQIGRRSARLVGVEPLTLPRDTSFARVREDSGMDAFLKSPGQTIVSPEMLLDLGEKDGATPALEGGDSLPPLRAIANAPPGALIVDIGVAQALLGRPERLSRLLMKERPADAAPALALITGDALRFVEAEEETDLSRLTDSFHLNLTAFGMLAYLVGLFIVHAAFGLAFEQRLGLVRTMRAVGVSARTLVVAMLCELLLFAMLAGAAGMICGYFIAAVLLPDVASSLDGLYGAQVAGRLTLAGQWWFSGLVMAIFGALVASASGLARALRLPVLSVAQPFAWRVAQGHYLRRQAIIATFGLAAALAAFVFGEGLYAGFIVMAGLLLGGALLLPLALAGALRLGEAKAKSAMSRWFWADSRQQLPGLALALMALLLALSTNIGVGTMVEGFRKTFTGWLDERLVAEVYFETATNADAQRIESWLASRSEVSAILPVWKTKTRLAGWPVDVMGLRSHETYRAHFPLMSEAGDAWDRVQRGGAALVSEQLARRLRLGVGDFIDIPTSGENWRAEIAGIYPDYGNAKGQLRIDLDALVAHWPDVARTSYSLRVKTEAVAGLIDAMQTQFGTAITRVIDQASIKTLSTGIFERTFAVTAALNSLTLIVSAVALLASLLTLSNLRLAQLAPVWAVGVTRRRLSWLEFSRIVLFAAATAVVALPLGLALAWVLVAVVNVEAFGWRLPFHVFPAQWALVFALALLTGAAAAVAPILRLARTAPADLLRIFANER